jgi:hypothetical protein
MGEAIERYVKLSDCVNMYIDESRQTSKEFRRLWALAFRGLTDIGLDVSWSPKQVVLPLNPNLTATLPIDYLNWVRVGVFNSFGELATLRVNEELTTYKAKDPDRISKIQNQLGGSPNYEQYPYWWGGWDDGDYEHYFGAGSGLVQDGDCKIDNSNKVIIFSPDFDQSQVVLQYMSSPVMNDDYVIDLGCQEALIAFLRWHDVFSLPSTRLVNISEKTMRQREYYTQKKLARKRMKPFRLQVAEQYSRESMRMAVKG